MVRNIFSNQTQQYYKLLINSIDKENIKREETNLDYLDADCQSDVNLIIEEIEKHDVVLNSNEIKYVEHYIRYDKEEKTKGLSDYWKEYSERKMQDELSFRNLKNHVINFQGYISEEDYKRNIGLLESTLCSGSGKKVWNNRWKYLLHHSKALNDVLSKLKIVSQEEYDKYIQSITPPATEKKLTAPDLGSGAVTCIILCCITFIFNYFWIYWIIIWTGYYFWYKERIRTFNPQHFRKEKKDEKL